MKELNMKMMAAIAGACLIALAVQVKAEDAANSGSSTESKVKSSRANHDPQELLAKIEKGIEKRQAQEQKALSSGNTDVAAALQKLIEDLNSLKAAINSNDKAAFKAANEKREQDKAALEALVKGKGLGKKSEKSSKTVTQS